jgi:hypothetical protein
MSAAPTIARTIASQQPPAADGLRDRAVGQVGADRDDGVDAREEDEQRRHQRAAAHSGETDEHADPEAEDDEQGIHQASTASGR